MIFYILFSWIFIAFMYDFSVALISALALFKYANDWLLWSKNMYIWLSAKRCVCNGWLGCAENKRCLIFCLFVCLECGLNVCENERGYSWNNSSRNFEAVWEICLIKCDFTAEIQPRKTDSGTEPVSVGVVWLKKTRKRYIYHICYVHERSFYKIVHASEKACIELYLIGRHLCRNTKRELSTAVSLCRNTKRELLTAVNRQLWKDLTNFCCVIKICCSSNFVAIYYVRLSNKLWAKNKTL